jgi:hypothetical protein
MCARQTIRGGRNYDHNKKKTHSTSHTDLIRSPTWNAQWSYVRIKAGTVHCFEQSARPASGPQMLNSHYGFDLLAVVKVQYYTEMWDTVQYNNIHVLAYFVTIDRALMLEFGKSHSDFWSNECATTWAHFECNVVDSGWWMKTAKEQNMRSQHIWWWEE